MFVFGYGSLSAEAPGAQVATLGGRVRAWDVAMDNRVDFPGYKYYLDPATGERPAVHVTFLDLVPAPGAACVGFLLPVDLRRLAHLDQRERNYDRVEVTDQISPQPAIRTRVYAYLGRAEARERYASAATAGRAVIARAYAEVVEDRFRRAGLWERYLASTRPPECPVADLERVNLPPSPAARARA